jgi:hypothetical protein
MPEPETVDLKTAYDELCRRHDGIAEFRAKLLALLPIASGAGIFLLVSEGGVVTAAVPHLLPVGVFGVLVTLGLYCYELRGIQECNALINAAREMEKVLLPNLSQFGAFTSRPRAVLGRTVGATGAALIIYPTVVGAWVYVGGLGAREALDLDRSVAIAAIAAGGAALLLGVVCGRLQRNQLHGPPRVPQH